MFQPKRPIGFNLNAVAFCNKRNNERRKILPKGFPASNDHKLSVATLGRDPLFNMGNDFERMNGRALACVVGIARWTLKIAASKTDEDRGSSRERTFPLNGGETVMKVERTLRMDV